jgi:hypothetical protein
MKELLLGILFILIVGIGGLVYRNAVEHPSRPINCPLEAKVCPDGTAVARVGHPCTFPVCPPPNVSLDEVGVSFAIPEGFAAASAFDSSSVATYQMQGAASSSAGWIIVRRYLLDASSTALSVIQKTALGGASGLPVSVTAYSSPLLGERRFTRVSLERFEGVVQTAYYLARAEDVLRFDAVDIGVSNWTDPTLGVDGLPAHAALIRLLTNLQGQ